MYVLQCGDLDRPGPGPDYRFGPVENAPADDVYPAGTVAMARPPATGTPWVGSSSWSTADSTIPADTAGGYTVVGTVTKGMDLLQQVAAAGSRKAPETPVTTVTIEKVDVE